MDDLGKQKHRFYIAAILVRAALALRLVLLNLDDIRLAAHQGDDTRDRIADDFMMVREDILPTVNAPEELLALIQSIILDWINLDSLAKLETLTELPQARYDAIEELAGRIAMTITVAHENWPDLFELDQEE